MSEPKAKYTPDEIVAIIRGVKKEGATHVRVEGFGEIGWELMPEAPAGEVPSAPVPYPAPPAGPPAPPPYYPGFNGHFQPQQPPPGPPCPMCGTPTRAGRKWGGFYCPNKQAHQRFQGGGGGYGGQGGYGGGGYGGY